jgi:hypothetical protein
MLNCIPTVARRLVIDALAAAATLGVRWGRHPDAHRTHPGRRRPPRPPVTGATKAARMRSEMPNIGGNQQQQARIVMVG